MTDRPIRRLISAVNKAVGALADAVARDLDHDNRAHPEWWKAVQEERAALLALDGAPEISHQPIRPEDIKPGDWIRFVRRTTVNLLAIVEDVDDSPLLLHTSAGQVWTADVLEVRRG